MLFSGAHSGNNWSDYSLFNKPILYANITATKLFLCFFSYQESSMCNAIGFAEYNTQCRIDTEIFELATFFYSFLPQERVTTPDSTSIFTVRKYQKFILSSEHEMPPNVCASNSKSIPSVHRWNHNDGFRNANKKNHYVFVNFSALNPIRLSAFTVTKLYWL